MKGQKNILGILFSKDRSLQLDASLSSFYKFCQDNRTVELKVLYTTTNERHKRQYEQLAAEYPMVCFVEEYNFKKNLYTLVKESDYLLFIVDDNIFIDSFYISTAIKILDTNKDVLGFSYRLGKNTTYCYMNNKIQPLPKFEMIDNNLLKYNWNLAYYDFAYPIEVSSSLYRTKDLLRFLRESKYTNPNTLEYRLNLAKSEFKIKRPNLTCYSKSISFSNPLNIVQREWNNRCALKTNYLSENLSEKFEKGFRIDINFYENLNIIGCHQEEPIIFKQSCQGGLSSNNKNKQISIVIVTYNRSNFLSEAIYSAMNQSLSPMEIVVVDDGSTDSTEKVVYSFRNDSIKYIKMRKNLGRSAARNMGIQKASGNYILWLDDDDIMEKKTIECYSAIIENYPKSNLIYGKLKYFGDCIKADKSYFDPNDLSIYKRNLVGQLITGCKIPNPCSLVKKELYQIVGKYNEKFERAEDYDFWVRASEELVPHKVDEVVCLYRCHENNSSFSNCMEYSYETKVVKNIINRWEPTMIFPDLKDNSRFHINDEFNKRVGQIFFKYHDYHNAMIHLLKISRKNMNDSIFSLILRCCINLREERRFSWFINVVGKNFISKKSLKKNLNMIENYKKLLTEMYNLMDQKKFLEAISKVELSLKKFDITADLMLILGRISMRIHSTQEGFTYFLKAVQCDPNNKAVLQQALKAAPNDSYKLKVHSIRERILY